MSDHSESPHMVKRFEMNGLCTNSRDWLSFCMARPVLHHPLNVIWWWYCAINLLTSSHDTRLKGKASVELTCADMRTGTTCRWCTLSLQISRKGPTKPISKQVNHQMEENEEVNKVALLYRCCLLVWLLLQGCLENSSVAPCMENYCNNSKTETSLWFLSAIFGHILSQRHSDCLLKGYEVIRGVE